MIDSISYSHVLRSCFGQSNPMIETIRNLSGPHLYFRFDSRFAPSQRETSLQSNVVSHWLGANLGSALNWLINSPSQTVNVTSVDNGAIRWHVEGIRLWFMADLLTSRARPRLCNDPNFDQTQTIAQRSRGGLHSPPSHLIPHTMTGPPGQRFTKR